jgi:OPT family small oligopeptide transporter
LYATDIMITQKFYYNQDFGWGWQILFGITTLCTGYGIAGVARRFLVWPAAMIWPADLVNAALFYTLHDHAPSDPTKTNGWSIGRYRWFLYVFTGAFVWYWFPGWIFQGLSFFAWITWIRPDDVIINQIFGNNTGYGIIPLCFDWTVISAYLNSPLIPPFWAIANNIAGVLIFFVFVSMGLRYSHKWYYDYLPVQSSRAFDNTGSLYNVSLILNEDNTFNEEAYHAYSPLYLSSQFTICYGVAFASVAAVIVHVALYHGREIVNQFKMARHQEDDVHMRMIKKYREAPDWWYVVLFVIMVGISFGVVCGWDTGFPAWGYVVCMLIPLFWTIPIGIVQAITNIQLGLNVITEFIVGYMIPGHPLAMMMFKNYGYLAMSQGLYFIQDLKLGHYMKVPPRVMFWSQLVASVWSAIVQVAVMRWALTAIPDICTPDQPNGYSCPNANVFFTASVIWGVIGPKRMFNGNALYQPLQYFWIAGALAPIVTYVLARRWPKSIFRYINTPIIFGGNGNIPPATVFVYLCWGTVGTIFNFFIRRKYTGWWLQYNYVTSAALDSGLIVSTIIVFFGLYLSLATPPQWFGNIGALSTLDAGNAAILSVLPPGATFGPSTWD